MRNVQIRLAKYPVKFQSSKAISAPLISITIIPQFTEASKRALLKLSMGKVANIASVAPIGFDGQIVQVESDVTNGLPNFRIVGMANKSIDEAKERVKSAITNSLLEFPARHITINLAPAELPKIGTLYDLPIALSILASSGQLSPTDTANAVFAGELALDGSIRPISAAVTIAETAKLHNYTRVYLPIDNVAQAALVGGIEIIGVPSLKALFLHLKGEVKLPPHTTAPTLEPTGSKSSETYLDEVIGQEQAKRALTIAAAGHHNILLSGPPGAGKTMLGKILTSLLPPLSDDECLAVTKLYSLATSHTNSIVRTRPFRTPHHTSSRISLMGGGTTPRPGEISLAHHGVLFLDEIPEYPRATLEALRQPLEDRSITITRANGYATYPADFILIATMNPCPCGFYGDPTRECSCSLNNITAYQQRLSGPLLDRIDMKVTVKRVPNDTLVTRKSSSDSQHKLAKKCIQSVRDMQQNRYDSCVKFNSNISNREIHKHAQASDEALKLLATAADSLGLSARSTFKTLKVARTIADLENSPTVETSHISEALQYR